MVFFDEIDREILDELIYLAFVQLMLRDIVLHDLNARGVSHLVSGWWERW